MSCAVFTPTGQGPGAERSSDVFRSFVAPHPATSVPDDAPLDDPVEPSDPEEVDPDVAPEAAEPLAAAPEPPPPLPALDPPPAGPVEPDPPLDGVAPDPPEPSLAVAPVPAAPLASPAPPPAALPLEAPEDPACGVEEQPKIRHPKTVSRVQVMAAVRISHLASSSPYESAPFLEPST